MLTTHLLHPFVRQRSSDQIFMIHVYHGKVSSLRILIRVGVQAFVNVLGQGCVEPGRYPLALWVDWVSARGAKLQHLNDFTAAGRSQQGSQMVLR
jgi:hypothetical protein